MIKNVIIGTLVVAVVVIGAVMLVNSNQLAPNTQTATTTDSGAIPSDTAPSPTPSQQAGVPTVIGDANTAASNSTAVVSGKVTPNGLQTSYWYEYGKTNALGTKTGSQAIGSGFIQISAPAYITGLSANTTYFFRLVAQNAFGAVSGATYSFATNNNPPKQGNAPTTRTNAATGISRMSVNLNGEANPNGSQTSYWFEYGESADLGNTTAFQSAGSGNVSVGTSVSLSNLKPLTKYYFRVDAQNQYGTVNGSILNFTTTGPAAPSAPKATTNAASNIASSSASLNGRVDSNGDTTTYWFEYGQNSLLGNILGSTTHTPATGSDTASITVSAKVAGLQSNTNYFYRLVATNSYGTVQGNIVKFQTKR